MESTEIKEDERTANFTSSKIFNLAIDGRKAGEPASGFYTYVDEKRFEAMAGRSLQNEARANALDWGNLCEAIAHEELGLEYQLVSKIRYKHASLPWSGMPDGLVGTEKVTDIKSPWTLKSFLMVYDFIFKTGEVKPNETTVAELLKKIKKEWYWQLISNSVLTEINTCELIMFMPKRKQIEEIQKASAESGKYYFHTKSIDELPWLADDSKIPSIVKITFEAPKEDQDKLIERVSLATNLLNK